MSKCCNCNVEILDETRCCPLCRSVVTPTEELENMYPNVRYIMHKLLLFSRIYLFCAIVVQAVLFGINLQFESEIWWSAITGLVLLCGYLVIRYAVLSKAGHKSKIFILALIGVLVTIAIDMIIGYKGWSVDYVLPSGILLVDAIIIGCMIYNRRNWQSYIMWQILMIVCSVFPIVLYLTGVEHNVYMSVLPMTVSAALFLGTVIIGDRRAWTELQRRFHIN